jgi:hypothetical protein
VWTGVPMAAAGEDEKNVGSFFKKMLVQYFPWKKIGFDFSKKIVNPTFF